jgi:hypothetical protein
MFGVMLASCGAGMLADGLLNITDPQPRAVRARD